MARKRGKRRLVDCTVECSSSGRHDFNVYPKPGETDKEACLRRAKDFSHAVDDCVTLRARGIDGIGKAGTPAPLLRFKDKMGSHTDASLTAAAARAQRACRIQVGEDCRDACRFGIRALEEQLRPSAEKKPQLDGVKPGRIVRE